MSLEANLFYPNEHRGQDLERKLTDFTSGTAVTFSKNWVYIKVALSVDINYVDNKLIDFSKLTSIPFNYAISTSGSTFIVEFEVEEKRKEHLIKMVKKIAFTDFILFP